MCVCACVIVWNVGVVAGHLGFFLYGPQYQRGRQLSVDRAAGQKQACGSVMETVRRQQPAQRGTLACWAHSVCCELVCAVVSDQRSSYRSASNKCGSHPACHT